MKNLNIVEIEEDNRYDNSPTISENTESSDRTLLIAYDRLIEGYHYLRTVKEESNDLVERMNMCRGVEDNAKELSEPVPDMNIVDMFYSLIPIFYKEIKDIQSNINYVRGMIG